MRMSIGGAFVVSAVFAGPTACGNSDVVTPGSQSNAAAYHMTAKIDGVAWTDVNSAQLGASLGAPGYYTINGGELSSAAGTSYGIVINTYGITSVGTYQLGFASNKAIVSYVSANGVWTTAAPNSGSITITELSSSRISGTFQATLTPGTAAGAAQATGTKVITDGDFSLVVRPSGR